MISSESIKAGPIQGNGATTSFPFTFKVFASSDLIVIRTDATGAETTLVLDSDYSVTLNGDQEASPGGSITYPISGSPLPSGAYLTIYNAPAFTQLLDLVNGGGFRGDNVETALDKLTVLALRLKAENAGAMRLSPGDVSGASTVLPTPEANTILGWDAFGTALRNYLGVPDVPATPWAATLLDDLDEFEACGTLSATQQIDDIATLRTISPVAGRVVYVKEHTSGTHSGGGVFEARTGAPSGTYADDNGITILPTGGNGSSCWRRDVDGVVTPQMFGAAGTGGVYTTELQAWLDYCYATGDKGVAPAGHYKHAGLSLGTALSRLNLEGAGCGDRQNYISAAPVGTVFEYTEPTGNGFTIGDGVTTNVQANFIKGIAFWGSTTGKIVYVNKAQGFNTFERIVVCQGGTGDGFGIEQSWVGSARDIYCYSDNALNNGRGFYWDLQVVQAGIVDLSNVNGNGFDRGVVLGHETQGTGLQLINIRGLIQGIQCNKGVVIGEAVRASDFIVWTENNATCGMQVFNEVTGCNFMHYSSEPDATEASLVIGKSGGSTLERTVSRCTFKVDFVNVGNVGIKVYQGSGMTDNVIDRPKMSAKLVGVGTAIDLGVASQNGMAIIKPELINFATNISGSQTLLNEYETTGQFGVKTRYAPYVQLGAVTLGSTTKLTTATTLDGEDGFLQYCNATGGAFTVTLPGSTANPGLRFSLKKTDASANAVTIARSGADVIEGAVSVSLAAQYKSYTLVSGGNGVWYIESAT